MIKILSLIFVAEIWNTAGQILFKKATNTLERPHLKSWGSYFSFVKSVFRMPAIWLGFAAMAVGLIIWLIALAQSDLSIVFPIGSMLYILTLIAARIFLNEKIDSMKLAGTLFVVVGIILIALSGN